MPEFIMNDQEDPEFQALDEFTKGYVEALFFTESCTSVDTEEFCTPEFQALIEEGQSDGRVPGDCAWCDFDAASKAQIIEDCAKFQAENAEGLAEALDNGSIDGYDERAAGRDFWYTRNGHGVGFWDRGLGDPGERLSEACGWRTSFPEVDVWFDTETRKLSC